MEKNVLIPDMEICKALHALRANFSRVFGPLARTEGLTMMQFFLLNGIDRGEIENINSVCRILEMAQGNASTLCKKLETDGFLRRERSVNDERIVTLSLTPQGKAAIQRLQMVFQQYGAELMRRAPEKVSSLHEGIIAANELLSLLNPAEMEG